MLPFPAAFGLPGRQVWVHTEEEFHAIRVAAGRVIPPEGNPASEQQNNPDEEQGQEGWGEEGWNDYGQGHQHQQESYHQQQYQQFQQQPHVQPQPRHDYVPRDEFNALVARVGDVESTLHDVNNNVLSLSDNITQFTAQFQH